MKKLTYWFFFLSVSILSVAQSRQIKGIVTDDAGAPVQGVSVLPKGSKSGTQTYKDGNFSITVEGAGNVTLSFSVVGHKATNVVTDGKTVLTVQMEKVTSRWMM